MGNPKLGGFYTVNTVVIAAFNRDVIAAVISTVIATRALENCFGWHPDF